MILICNRMKYERTALHPGFSSLQSSDHGLLDLIRVSAIHCTCHHLLSVPDFTHFVSVLHCLPCIILFVLYRDQSAESTLCIHQCTQKEACECEHVMLLLSHPITVIQLRNMQAQPKLTTHTFWYSNSVQHVNNQTGQLWQTGYWGKTAHGAQKPISSWPYTVQHQNFDVMQTTQAMLAITEPTYSRCQSLSTCEQQKNSINLGFEGPSVCMLERSRYIKL